MTVNRRELLLGTGLAALAGCAGAPEVAEPEVAEPARKRGKAKAPSAELQRIPEIVGCSKHREGLLPAALDSIVLLEAAGDGALPIESANITQVQARVIPVDVGALARELAQAGANSGGPTTSLRVASTPPIGRP